MERFESQLQVRLVREQLRWERREARWARRQLKLDLRSIKPVDVVAVERFKKSLIIKVPVYKQAKPKEREKPKTEITPKFAKKSKVKKKIKKPVVVKPVKKRLIEIKKEIYKEPEIEKPRTEIPKVEPKEIVTVKELGIVPVVLTTTKPVRYRCAMCGTISTEPVICCGKEMEEWS